jgi:hypothetical protein
MAEELSLPAPLFGGDITKIAWRKHTAPTSGLWIPFPDRKASRGLDGVGSFFPAYPLSNNGYAPPAIGRRNTWGGGAGLPDTVISTEGDGALKGCFIG